jgi:hypothetical protein
MLENLDIKVIHAKLKMSSLEFPVDLEFLCHVNNCDKAIHAKLKMSSFD